MKENVIVKVDEGSIGSELGIVAGDVLLEVNGKHVKDVFDYRYNISDEEFEITIKKANGETIIYEIEKDAHEELGITFESDLMDNARSCRNKCIFCFIDQLPPDMRDTVYFKDDDIRLSFLLGNYVTLTNAKISDIYSITKYHLSPINISVHTTNLKLRTRMLNNRHAARLMEYIQILVDAKISLNFQIVLCKGVNDGKELDKSISELARFLPYAKSLSVVPVGLTKYRDGLHGLEPFNSKDATKILMQIHSWQDKIFKLHGKNFVHAADEFYLLAGERIPSYNKYDGFQQLENGVGMLALMKHDLMRECKKIVDINKMTNCCISIVTGEAAHLFMRKVCRKISAVIPNVSFRVHCIKNEFFGGHVTVSGLLTGNDIISQLKDKAGKMGDVLLIPQNAIRDGDTVFLDNVDIANVEEELKIKVRAGKCSAKALLTMIAEIAGN